MLRSLLVILGIFLCVVPGQPSYAASELSLAAGAESAVSDADLQAVADKISKIYTARLTSDPARDTGHIAKLRKQALEAEARANDMVTALQPFDKAFANFLDVLGPAPAKDAPPEAPDIAYQRAQLVAARHDLATRMERAKLYALEAHQLTSTLNRQGNAAQQALLFQKFPSPLDPDFWSSLAEDARADASHLPHFVADMKDFAATSFAVDRLVPLGLCTVGAALLVALMFSFAHHVRRFTSRFIHQGHTARVVAACARAVGCSMLAGFAVQLFWIGLTAGTDLPGSATGRMLTALGQQLPLAVFVMAACKALLSPDLPEWRIVALKDEVVGSVRAFPIWFALLLILRGLMRYLDTESGASAMTVQLADALFVFVSSPLLFQLPRRVGAISPGEPGAIAPILRTLVTAFAGFCLIAVLFGYVPLAYRSMSWVFSMCVTLLGLGLILMLVNDLGRSILPASGPVGQRFTRLGLPAVLLDQAAVVLTGLASVFLAFIALAVAESGGDFNLAAVGDHIALLLSGQSVAGITLSYGAVLKCVAVPVVGYYIIRVVQNWLKKRYFPTTHLDLGAQTSIVSIITYCAWILVGLALLSAIGVTVQSMTWVVSALSVGIGFGLQSIVQNFVSGIILLAERPVTIGDLVEIGGVRGDIQRISVRSTDLRLGDGSTMIVPNSQFITSSVRNVTFGRPPGSVSVSVDLPVTADIDAAIASMNKAMLSIPTLREEPSPSVSVAALKTGVITLTASGSTNSPRDVDAAQAAARLAIWQGLHELNIPLAEA